MSRREEAGGGSRLHQAFIGQRLVGADDGVASQAELVGQRARRGKAGACGDAAVANGVAQLIRELLGQRLRERSVEVYRDCMPYLRRIVEILTQPPFPWRGASLAANSVGRKLAVPGQVGAPGNRRDRLAPIHDGELAIGGDLPDHHRLGHVVILVHHRRVPAG